MLQLKCGKKILKVDYYSNMNYIPTSSTPTGGWTACLRMWYKGGSSSRNTL